MDRVLFWYVKGNAICFYYVFGHDVFALYNKYWKKIMLRGTEWAAKGSVSSFYRAGINCIKNRYSL
ncbi:hypothetical protein MHTCC0001_37380 [Flavobacteriaceae bacterium MHTCC 0001]